MDRIQIKIKRLGNHNLPLPKYMTEHSSGMDIYARVDEDIEICPNEIKLIPTGFSISVPIGFEAQIRPRSGLALKHGISLVNTPGTIDSDYRGEIKIIIINLGKEKFIIKPGCRIAQMIICPVVVKAQLIEVDDLDDTLRSDGGFGSTEYNSLKLKAKN